jgi:uncharacterized protein (TIGR02246 family)
MKRLAKIWKISLLACAMVSIVYATRSNRSAEKTMSPESDAAAVERIVQEQVAAWNQGDAAAYSQHFATDGSFTNIRGQFFKGYEAFLKQHEVIFQSIFKKTTLQQDIVSLKFIRPDVAVVETLTSVSGLSQTSPGTTTDSAGRLRTRLLQVVVKEGKDWKIVSYHNVDVKPGVPVPEPR